MQINPIRIKGETTKARLCEWYDVESRKYVTAWIPKSVSNLQHTCMTLSKGIYYQILAKIK